MERKDIEILEAFDPAKLTLEDLSQLKNSVLREALSSALQSLIASGAQHTNHWAFGSHMAAMLRDAVFPKEAGPK